MHLARLSLLGFALVLLSSTVQAQRARCVDANGFGYECSGSAARAAEQNALSGHMPKQQLHIDLNKLGSSPWEDSKSSRPASGFDHAGSEPSIQRKPDPLDAWPGATRTAPRH